MKTIHFISFFLYVTTTLNAQSVKLNDFISLFDLCDYPIIISDDYSKSTKISASIRSINENLLQQFVYDQGIKKVRLACNLNSFQTYFTYFQLPQTDSAFIVTLLPDMKDAACGEGILLVTYSKSHHHVQDTLWISLRSALEPQYIDNKKIVCNLDVESTLTNDSISMDKTESFYLRHEYGSGIPTKKVKTTTYHIIYKMTQGGKFIKIRERKEDEILDPIANKLE
jgi:hypothetical protein